MRRVFRVHLNLDKTLKKIAWQAMKEMLQRRAITLPTHVAVQRLKGRGF